MNWKDALKRWQRWTRERRSHRNTLSWLQRSPDELTILSERERAAADSAAVAAAASSAAAAASRPAPLDPSPSNGEMTLVEDSTQPGGAVLGVFVAVDGELEGEVFSLREGRLQLGRSSASDVVLASRWISRDHARLDCSPGSFVLTAISDKKTLVNGDRLLPGSENARTLKDGDQVDLGRTHLRLRMVE